jgi:7-keto-8-aminopelargonate synthetase-like enzyme
MWARWVSRSTTAFARRGSGKTFVQHGTARIRTQMSAAHTTEDLDFALDQFQKARELVAP